MNPNHMNSLKLKVNKDKNSIVIINLRLNIIFPILSDEQKENIKKIL